MSIFNEVCVCVFLGKGPRLQRYVTQGGQASECYVALRGGLGGPNRKFLRYVFFERPLFLTSYGYKRLDEFLLFSRICLNLRQD